MDGEAARAELGRAVRAARDPATRARAGQRVLLAYAAETFGAVAASLDAAVRIAASSPRSAASRAFAVLLVHALGIPDVVPPRGATGLAVRGFIEAALLNPLRRANYPFDGTPYDKRQALCALHATIEEHLNPPEATMPGWLHGLGPAP